MTDTLQFQPEAAIEEMPDNIQTATIPGTSKANDGTDLISGDEERNLTGTRYEAEGSPGVKVDEEDDDADEDDDLDDDDFDDDEDKELKEGGATV